jgi:phosphoglycolate phosphatase
MLPTLILIDLDGTLIDSVPDLAHAADAMLSKLGFPKRGEAAARQWIGNGIERFVKRALTGQMAAEPEEALFEQALPLFKHYYAECNGRYSTLYPGVREGLDFLKSKTYPLACITNKAAQFTIPLLKTLNVYEDFRLVLSGDSLPKQKPDPLPLLHAAEYFHSDPHQSLMIGDSINDVQAARAANFQIICVSYGYNHGEDIRTAGADAVIDSLLDLPPWLTMQEELRA